MNKVITKSERETIKLGIKIACQLRGGEVVALYGNLGAGKTTLIKGIAKGLGVTKIITSPTFVLMKIYKITKTQKHKDTKAVFHLVDKVIPPRASGHLPPSRRGETIRSLVHIDCYRVNDAQEILDIGAAEYFNEPETVTVIEWADRIKKILPKDRMEIRIKTKNKNQRVIEVH
jgi:tRNA threonylcarbamoyladenosine biosynthesis protein TsaE